MEKKGEKRVDNTKLAEKLRIWAILLFIMSLIFIFIGFYKVRVYENSEYGPSKNAYVGGDAYNYIINGTYFAGYCALGGAFFVSGVLTALFSFRYANENSATSIKIPDSSHNDENNDVPTL